MNLKELFTVPIGILNLNDKHENLRKVNDQLIKDFIGSLIDYGYKNSTGVLETYQSNRNLEHNSEAFSNFLSLIKPHVDCFLKEIRYSESFTSTYKLSNVWGNLTAGTGMHTSHVHGKGSQEPFSLVYFPCEYVDPENIENIQFKKSSTEDSIGSLLLYSPGWEVKEISFKQNDSHTNNQYTQLVYRINPKEGLLVIFPSFLSHLVTPSKEAQKDNARISFSFFAKF